MRWARTAQRVFPLRQAARTCPKNLPTDARSISAASSFADDRTWVAAEPVSAATWVTPPTLLVTCSLRRLLDVAGDLLGRGTLLLDRRRDRRRD
ncbi:MAG TPA: hypothetical protein VL966_15840 [Alphaproteobacteria bacterium]|nr:hypothetical protein [Alphaproteobacteria bacterium]